MLRPSRPPESKLDSHSLGAGRTLLELFVTLSLSDVCYSPCPPSRFLPVSLSPSLSVMLSSRPAFCPPLSPPWVSIPNMVILLGLYQRPPSLIPALPAVGSTVQAIDRKASATGERRQEEGPQNERRRRNPLQLCFYNKSSRENFFTLKNFPLRAKGTNF